jgi:glycosyltransferase involved in cell wall biosynthesis
MTPRVTLDIQALQSVAHAERGIGRYVADHASALLAAGAPVERCLLNPLLPPPHLPDALDASGRVAWATERVFAQVAEGGPFVHHMMSPFEDVRPADGLVARPAYSRARALVMTLYDVIPYVMAGEYQRSWWNRQFLRRRAALLRTADLVCAISQSAARGAVEVLGLDPDRVTVIGAAAAEHFRPPGPDEDVVSVLRARVPAITRPYVLTVTGDDPRKDPLGLIDAYAALPRGVRDAHQLVMVCTLLPHTERMWRDHAARRGLAPGDVVFTGFVDDATLRACYQQARLFVFASRHEGFGLPVLEAARCGAPAITADNSSLPEVLDEPASCFPTGDTEALADLMRRALEDEPLRAQLLDASRRAAARHRWDAVARATIDGYAWLDRPRHARRSAAPRVALVGPFPPAASGVADYNERVAGALAPLVELDCYAEVDPPYTRGATAGRRFAIGAFDRTFSAAGYDTVVYTLGNSRYHRATLDHALAYPGIVWLHDACLAGLYLTRAGLYLPGVPTEAIDFHAAEASMRAARQRCDGDGAPWLGDDWWRPEAYVDAGVLMLGEVLRAARAVIVSSETARGIVEVHAPSTAPPVHVLPLAIPDPPAVGPAGETDDGTPWIVSLGVVATVKRIELLIDAFARVRARTPARLAVVGNVDLPYAEELRERARAHGVGDDVVITGLVPSDEYARWVQRATVVVQLRTRSVGEGSATVTDALAATRAVVTNVGAATELPDGVVDRLPVDVGVDVLADHIERVLRDRDHRDTLRHHAAAFAHTHSFADVAQQVLEIAAATAEPAYPDRLAATA